MKTIAAYTLERFPLRVFAPAILVHAAIAWWVSAGTFVSLPVALCLTGLLFVQFRLWDDLEDVGHDRIAHPDRVLVNVERRAFWLLLSALLTITAAILAAAPMAASVFVLLLLFFAASYHLLRGWVSEGQWRYGLLLVKYPAYVWIVAARIGEPADTRLAAGAAIAYAAAASYEFWHTRMEAWS